MNNNEEKMPPLWWLNPWTFAVQQWNARARIYGYWQTADKNGYAAAIELTSLRNKRLVEQQAILDTANQAGFTESKTGYFAAGMPSTPFPLEWLGKAVAYWKSEAYAARRERDDAKSLADYHRNNLNTFQRKVEVTLKPVCPHLYEDTIGYVDWSAEEIGRLQALVKEKEAKIDELYESHAELSIERDDAKADKNEADKHHAEEHKANVLLQRELADVKSCHIDALAKISHLELALKKERARKALWYPRPSKPKAKPKAKAKKKVQYGDAREKYAALFRDRLAEAKAKAKKKGGRRG